MAEQANSPQSGESQASYRTGCPSATTPERYTFLPPSPPATDERRQQTSDAPNEGLAAIEMLTNAANRDNLTFVEVTLEKHQYKQHEKQLERLFRRHDYDPGRGLLVVRMPSTVHEYFLNRFVDLVTDQLKETASSATEASQFASQIESIGSARIFLREENRETALRRQPDAQFQHADAVYPGVVVEISCSQDGKRLSKLAQDYILGSNGDIKVVICIDINPHGKESTASIWRSKFTRSGDEYILESAQDGPCMPFRTQNGLSTNQGEQLTLYLSDFATDEI
ncbi:hypothetical protein TOPH_08961 [Tolypocladium ophioglossoides CBS 100239]|uniref:Restriction endonuclease domain-containing protein n=1 Tax=Tolypocladium ophioglossoides (strain CBS 100239) TaxID=1163406 RepID=A0A0L0MY60_TOLOC|nr:hypothetical protein TOPH_08961 [Tolypocladium ophioglossoides CBS 100239]